MSDPFFSSMGVAASGMAAQRTRMDVVSENIANADATRTEDGGPYRRQMVVFGTQPVKKSFGEVFKGVSDGEGQSVAVQKVIKDQADFRKVYEPSHPDADAKGMVSYPNVNATQEMMDFMAASRSFEANVSVFEASKRMFQKSMTLMK
jgi:flagellar basal-body rod protein FlgC